MVGSLSGPGLNSATPYWAKSWKRSPNVWSGPTAALLVLNYKAILLPLGAAGAHTVGQARCTNFRSRIYNDTNINSTYAASLKSTCPQSGDDNNTAPLKPNNYTSFDNDYYGNLLVEKGLLHSDQEIYNGGGTSPLVTIYAENSTRFFEDFGESMIKMGNISPLTGSSGQIRSNCRVVNSASAI
ncbi:hypothetical protein Nepgr_028222 [Nepenthes gracilis]|uniref:peroxidase n=1 Tax=Nepenthes gracilis TaxID=150966 RepID=A0AAD3TBS8_NEPGR|nr:hypothetical protein Nepgr_028222 [Nepenthes gracilis]